MVAGRNGRWPIVWQIELIDQVTWCSRKTRTSEAQKNAVSAPCQDQVIRPPSTAGASSENAGAGRRGRPARCRVGEQVGRVLRWSVCSMSNSQPRCACPRPLVSGRRVAEPPGRVRVALAVGERVVLAVIGDPADDRALDGQRAGDRERDPQRPVRLERAVREVAVEADGDAEPGDHVEDEGEHDVGPRQPAPQASGTAASTASSGMARTGTPRPAPRSSFGRLRACRGGSRRWGRCLRARWGRRCCARGKWRWSRGGSPDVGRLGATPP